MRAGRLVAALACALIATGCTGDEEPERVNLYDRAPVPAVPDRTAEVGSSLASGQYWAELIGMERSDAPFLTFRVTRAYFGPTCLQELGEDGCPNDYGVDDSQALEVRVPFDDLQAVSVANGDRQNYGIDAEELARLLVGEPASSKAPDDFAYVAYPFLLTVRDGTVQQAQQIWVP